MHEEAQNVTLWLAWYADADTKAVPGSSFHLRMLYAPSETEARSEMQHWLEARGRSAGDLEQVLPSPYGLQFSANSGLTNRKI